MYQINIKKLPGYEDLPVPQKMSQYASGFDIYAGVEAALTVKPGERVLIPAGFAIEMMPGVEAQIRPRSGLALKHGITMLNTPGTIDSDYRGHVQIILVNLGNEDFIINRGDRIAQMVFMEIPQVVLKESEELNQTLRSSGGFGHSGK